jgi:hypothetical protein
MTHYLPLGVSLLELLEISVTSCDQDLQKLDVSRVDYGQRPEVSELHEAVHDTVSISK